ncbi:hypothetical protein ACQ4PT_039886 [Festuca glaucescens]
MLPRSHSHTARRRSGLGPQLCAVAAALLLLLSLAVLHSRLSSSSPFPLSSSSRSSTSDSAATNSTALLADDDVDAVAAALDPDLTLTTVTTTAATEGGAATNPDDDRIDELDVLDEDDSSAATEAADDVSVSATAGSLLWDHAAGVARQPFRLPAAGDPLPVGLPHLDSPRRIAAAAFGSDDEPVDLELRVEISSISGVEDALLLKPASGRSETRLRSGWARWLEGKADYLRRDRMLRSNLELLNPRNHPLLQDPDSPGLTALTRGDRMVQRMLHAEIEKDSSINFGRRSLQSADNEHVMGATVEEPEDGRRWGYFPGVDPHLGFSEFMEKFFEYGKCSMRVFMVWNSPQWAYGARHQRGLESLFLQHPDACVVVLSETLELEAFQEFVKEGYKVAVAVPNLDELLEGTPTHIFASVWYEWRKTINYPLHYSELVRLAALYRFGGIYLDSDVVVLKPLKSFRNSVGTVKQVSKDSSFSGAVLVFEKKSPFLAECLKEWYSTYDDTLIQWNGAELMTRVIRNHSDIDQNREHLDIELESSFTFYPISSTDIMSYFSKPDNEAERAEHDALFLRIVNDSTTFHLWNSITSSLVPESNSLVERILNHYCLHCLDVL